MKKGNNNYSYDMNRIAQMLYELPEGENLYRIFRVYHPVYDAELAVETDGFAPEYHILERYMDRIICGDRTEIGDNRSYVKNKTELFDLLGMGRSGYRVADIYYESLKNDGHIVERSDGIYATRLAYDSVKLKEKRINKTLRQRRLLDAYDGRLLSEFANEKRVSRHSVDPGLVNPEDTALQEAAWLPIHYINETTRLAAAVKAANYSGDEQQKYGLPNDFRRISIPYVDETFDINKDIVLKYFPYYLAMYKKGNNIKYKAFVHYTRKTKDININEMRELTELSQKYTGHAYRAEIEALIDAILNPDHKHKKNRGEPEKDHIVKLPKFADKENQHFIVAINDVPVKENGFSLHKFTGNYIWSVKNSQLQCLLGLETDTDGQLIEGRYFSDMCRHILSNQVLYYKDYNINKCRIIYINLTEEQLHLLCSVLTGDESYENRKALFDEYMTGKDPDDGPVEQLPCSNTERAARGFTVYEYIPKRKADKQNTEAERHPDEAEDIFAQRNIVIVEEEDVLEEGEELFDGAEAESTDVPDYPEYYEYD